MTDSPDTSTVIKALVDDDLESLSTDQLRKRLDALGEKRGTLAEKKSNLVSHLSEVKGGEHTQESFEELNETKSKIQEVESDLSELKTAQKGCPRTRGDRPAIETGSPGQFVDAPAHVGIDPAAENVSVKG